MVRDGAIVTIEIAYGKLPSLFRMVTITDPIRLPLSETGVPNTPHYQLRDACCHLANMIEDIDKAAVCCAGCYYELSDVAFCQITLAVVWIWETGHFVKCLFLNYIRYTQAAKKLLQYC